MAWKKFPKGSGPEMRREAGIALVIAAIWGAIAWGRRQQEKADFEQAVKQAQKDIDAAKAAKAAAQQ